MGKSSKVKAISIDLQTYLPTPLFSLQPAQMAIKYLLHYAKAKTGLPKPLKSGKVETIL
jgi:hypothetical protein